jgi:hypothetical protein
MMKKWRKASTAKGYSEDLMARMDSGGRERPTSRSRIHRKNVLLHALVVLLCFLFVSSVKHKWIF